MLVICIYCRVLTTGSMGSKSLTKAKKKKKATKLYIEENWEQKLIYGTLIKNLHQQITFKKQRTYRALELQTINYP